MPERNCVNDARSALASQNHWLVSCGFFCRKAAAIIISDLVVMPMQASGFDLWATDELKSMIEEAKIYKPEIIHAVLLNRVVPNTNLAKDVLADMQENGWTFFDTVIGQRQNFANAATQGLTVFEVANSKAAQDEILFMVDEILKLKD